MTQPIEMFRDLPRPGAFAPQAVIRELGDGLVLRQASQADCEALTEFNVVVQADPPEFTPLPMMGDWTRDLMSGHPRVRASDFLLVDDTRQKRVAATTMLFSHRFSYGGTEFDAGQPELVGTHPDYRRRGLVRQMFDVLHGWSAERGQRMQVIGGIPAFYRQFGYEFAIEHGVEWRAQAADLPDRLEPGVQARDAEPRDVPLLMDLYQQRSARHRLVCLRDAEQWRYEIEVRREGSDPAWTVALLERADGSPLAVTAHRRQLRHGRLQVVMLEVVPGVSQGETAASLLAELRRRAEAFASRDGESFSALSFYLGSQHPFHDVARGQVEREPGSFALYVRVPDLVDFLSHVAPALETRLAESAFAGESATLELSCYREGIRLVLEAGRIRAVEPWTPSTAALGQLAFPERSFVQLLMGFRSLAELEQFHPDCLIYDERSGALVEALFPAQQTGLWPTF